MELATATCQRQRSQETAEVRLEWLHSIATESTLLVQHMLRRVAVTKDVCLILSMDYLLIVRFYHAHETSGIACAREPLQANVEQ